MMPFPGGIEGGANGILILSIVAALLYLPVISRPPSLRRTIVKAGSVALLAALSFEAGAPLLLVAALALSALGDAALAQEEERFFLAGVAGFLFAHIAYTVLFLRAGSGVAAFMAAPWLAIVALAVVGVAGGMLALLWRRVASLLLPVAAYTVAIVAMVLSALTVPILPLVIGALLFLASDVVIAREKFLAEEGESRRPAAAIAGWLLYYAAQLSITLAVVLAT